MIRKITDIREVQQICLDMAKESCKILEKYNIPYYMVGGSLLGAIRHKGFIPWDDDMDFAIPRKFYQQAIDVLKKDLIFPYSCITFEDNDTQLLESCKVHDVRTKILQEDNYGKDHIGVFIDFFPFDYSDGKTGLFSNYSLIRTLIRLQNFRFTHVKGRSNVLKFLSFFVKIIFVGLKRNTIPVFIKNHCILAKGNYIINNYGLYTKREIVPISYVGLPTKYTFEDTEFNGVINFDAYLKNIYGNYMKLPPENKRHIHLLDIEIEE